jgi:hypothetical protein
MSSIALYVIDSVSYNPTLEVILLVDSSQADASKPKVKTKSKRRKTSGPPTKSLLTLMNSNLDTMKRVRRTHAKFAALNRNGNNNNEDEGESPTSVDISGEVYGMGADADVVIDERPWKPPGAGIEIGEANADACVGWMARTCGFSRCVVFAVVS